MLLPPPSEKQARVIWMAVTALAVAALLVVLAALMWGLGRVLNLLAPVLWPIAVAGVIAYLLDPVVDLLERRRVSRPRAILCVFALALMVVGALFGSVVPQLVTETRQLVLKVPTYAQRTQARVEDWANHPPALVRRFLQAPPETLPATNAVPAVPPHNPATSNPPGNLPAPAAVGGTNVVAGKPADPELAVLWSQLFDPSLVQSATGVITRLAPKLGVWIFGQVTRMASWLGVLAGLALIPVYTFYFLLEKRGIQARWSDYLPVAKSGFKDELVFVLSSINDYLIAFFRGQVLVAISDGVLYTLGFVIIGLPYAVLLGAMATCLTMIPFLGAIVTCLTALIIAFVQFGDWLHPMLVLAVFGVVQSLEGMVISPKIMGDRVGLHPLSIIIAVMVGTTLLGGILGGILAIPLTAALRVLMFRYVWRTPDSRISADRR